MRGKLFTQRVVSALNTLSGAMVEADMIVAFKMLLDRLMDMQGLE